MEPAPDREAVAKLIFWTRNTRKTRRNTEFLWNYLKATQIEVGYVINFGVSPKFKRVVYDNDRKGSLKWVPK